MYTIKRYANGRFYDTEEKNFITRERIAEMIKSGKKFSIINTKTGKDITDEIVSQIKSKQGQANKKTRQSKSKSSKAKEDPGSYLIQFFRKSGDTLFDYGKKYVSMWQGLFTMSREELDKLINRLVKDQKITEVEGKKLKSEIQRYSDNVQNWLNTQIDTRVNDMLNRMNLASREQIQELTEKIESLNKKLAQVEKTRQQQSKSKASTKKTAGSKASAKTKKSS
ncbi:MAG: polyhydroxyalkanoate synthesis regulator DNA-binding domain-containing protein [Desulfobacterales bacterium]|nr:polyhydroxyalkanoate synthesis regulator DNA-binding domain-containing protein [Desulfobacterales bacterium]